MCNLYSMTKNVDAIRRLFDALNSRVGNRPRCPASFPTICRLLQRCGRTRGRDGAMGLPTCSADGRDEEGGKAAEYGQTVDFKELLRLSRIRNHQHPQRQCAPEALAGS
jgi:hypothetical protein